MFNISVGQISEDSWEAWSKFQETSTAFCLAKTLASQCKYTSFIVAFPGKVSHDPPPSTKLKCFPWFGVQTTKTYLGKAHPAILSEDLECER